MKRNRKTPAIEPPKAKPEVRKKHKEALRLNAQEAERDRKHPEPMSIFHKREKAKEIPEVRLPKPMVTLGQIDKAATAMAAWDNADPFAYNRTALHVRQGYLHPDDVIKEMNQRTLARKAAKVREIDNAKA